MERIEAQIEAERAAELKVREDQAEAHKIELENYMEQLCDEIKEAKAIRDAALSDLSRVEAEYDEASSLAEEEASLRIQTCTNLKEIYAEVEHQCHILQLEKLRQSGPETMAEASEAREVAQFAHADKMALVNAEAHLDSVRPYFDAQYLRDHDARRGLSPEKLDPEMGRDYENRITGSYLGQPVGPREPMPAEKLLLAPSVMSTRSRRTKREPAKLVKNLLTSDPRYSIPSRFAPP